MPTVPPVSPAILLPADFCATYIPVAKAACSSIKMAIRRLYGMPDPAPWWTIHQTKWPLTIEHDHPEVLRGMVRSGHRLFTCVRNPWDRLHAVWRHKFHLDRWNDLSQHHQHLRIDMKFVEFVRALENIDLESANEHLRPQMDILWPLSQQIEDGAVLHVETLAGDWTYFWHNILMRKNAPPLPHINHGGSRDQGGAYDRGTRDRVEKLYAKDVHKLGYSF